MGHMVRFCQGNQMLICLSSFFFLIWTFMDNIICMNIIMIQYGRHTFVLSLALTQNQFKCCLWSMPFQRYPNNSRRVCNNWNKAEEFAKRQMLKKIQISKWRNIHTIYVVPSNHAHFHAPLTQLVFDSSAWKSFAIFAQMGGGSTGPRLVLKKKTKNLTHVSQRFAIPPV